MTAAPPRTPRTARPAPRGEPVSAGRRTGPSRRRRVVLWSLAVVTVLVVGALGAVCSPWLAIDTVEVVGAPPERVDEVRRAAGIDPGEPILALLPGRAAGRVRALPWVLAASVRRDLPGAVRIEVVPRVPVGWVATRAGGLVVDGTGHVLWRAPERVPGLPELVGVAELARPGGRIGPPEPARVAAALDPGLRGRSAAVVLADGAVTVRLTDGPEIRFGAPRAVSMKARVAAAVLAVLAEPTAYVDVSVPAAPVSGRR